MKKHTLKASTALISILIISAVTLLLVIGMAETQSITKKQSFNTTNNRIMYYNAESCMEEAMIRLEKDTNFTTGSLSFDSGATCSMQVSGTSNKTINIQIQYNEYAENFRATALLTESGQAKNMNLSSWEEVP